MEKEASFKALKKVQKVTGWDDNDTDILVAEDGTPNLFVHV